MNCAGKPPTPDGRAIWRRLLPVWVALMALLAVTLTSAYLPLGGMNAGVALCIAAMKCLLIALFFMQLRRPDPLLRLAAGAATLWIAFLFALTFADLLTRAR